MKIKRFSIITFLLITLQAALVQAVSLAPVTDSMRWIFFGLSGSAAFQVWLKFAFFVIIFALLYNGGLRGFKSAGAPMKRALVVITLIIALIAAIFVPYRLLLYIFKLYYVILVVLFAILPAFIGFLINRSVFAKNERGNRIIRAFIYIMIGIFILGLIGNIENRSSPDTEMFMMVLEPLLWGALLAIVAGFMNFMMALGGDTVASKLPGWLKAGAGEAPKPKGSKGSNDPKKPAKDDKAAAPDEQKLFVLRQQIAQFSMIVSESPGSLKVFLEQRHREFEAIIRLTDPQRSNGVLRLLIQFQQHQTNAYVKSARAIMDTVLANAQYKNVEEKERKRFEKNIAAFILAQARFYAINKYIQQNFRARGTP